MPLPGMRRDGRIKPEWGAQLDRDLSICRDIAGVWAMLAGTPYPQTNPTVWPVGCDDDTGQTPAGIPSVTGLFPVPGDMGYAMQFPHLNQAFLNLPLTSAVNYSGSFTIMSKFMWQGGTPSYNPLMSRWNDAGTIGYGLSLTPTNTIRGDSQNVALGGGFQGSKNVSSNVLHDAAFTVDAAGPRAVYLDGLLDTGSSTGGVAAGTAGSNVFACIGQDGSFTNSSNAGEIRAWNGWIEYVYFWHRVLSGEEIAELHERPYIIYMRTMFETFYSIAGATLSAMAALSRSVVRATATMSAAAALMGTSLSVASARSTPSASASLAARGSSVTQVMAAPSANASISGLSRTTNRSQAGPSAAAAIFGLSASRSPVTGSLSLQTTAIQGRSASTSTALGAIAASAPMAGLSRSSTSVRFIEPRNSTFIWAQGSRSPGFAPLRLSDATSPSRLPGTLPERLPDR